MKYLFYIFVFGFHLSHSQINCDSVLIEKQIEVRNFKIKNQNLQYNIQQSKEYFILGTEFVSVGLWIRLMAVTGKEYEYIDKKDENKCFIIASAFELTGIFFVFYSYNFINKASIKVTPTKLTYTFK